MRLLVIQHTAARRRIPDNTADNNTEQPRQWPKTMPKQKNKHNRTKGLKVSNASFCPYLKLALKEDFGGKKLL